MEAEIPSEGGCPDRIRTAGSHLSVPRDCGELRSPRESRRLAIPEAGGAARRGVRGPSPIQILALLAMRVAALPERQAIAAVIDINVSLFALLIAALRISEFAVHKEQNRTLI